MRPRPPTGPLRILLVDDHVLVSEGLRLVLRGLAEQIDVEVCGLYADAREQLERGRFELVLLDYFVPDRIGEEDVRGLVELAAPTPVVLLSSEHDAELVGRVFALGARGFISKRSTAEVMLAALRLILSGGIYVPPEVIADQLSVASASTLTQRQRDVLQLLVDGKTNKQIAALLGTSESTVRVHLSAIFRALRVENRTQAASVALRERLVRQQNK